MRIGAARLLQRATTRTLVGIDERHTVMTALVIALLVLELLAYSVLLGRLASVTRERRPTVFAAVGAPDATDYLMLGWAPGDSFISKLESRRSEMADEPRILRLMRAVRGAYVILLLTVCVAFLLMLTHAN